MLLTHHMTLWMTDLRRRHSGQVGDLGGVAVWTVAALVVAFAGTRQRLPRGGAVESEAARTRRRVRALERRWVPRLRDALARASLGLAEQDTADAARSRWAPPPAGGSSQPAER